MKKRYRLNNLDCANCAAKLERALAKLEGVTAARVSFLTQSLTLEGADAQWTEVEAAARATIRRLEPEVVLA